MKTKLILGAIFIALVASLAFGGKQFAMNVLQPIFSFKKEIPDHVLYETIFRIRTKSHKKEEKDRKVGIAAEKSRDILTNKFGLSEDDDAKLTQAANEFAEAIAPVDKRAKEITDERRKQNPGGMLKEGELPPPPSAEIVELQELRNAIVLYHRDKLRSELGSNRFSEMDEKVKGEFANGFRDRTNDVTTRRVR